MSIELSIHSICDYMVNASIVSGYVSRSIWTVSFESVKEVRSIFTNTENFLKFPVFCVISSMSVCMLLAYEKNGE